MSKFNFKNVVQAMAKVEGVPMTQVARDLQCDSSVLSNILSGRFTSANKEELLKERTIAVLTEFIGEVLDTPVSHIKEYQIEKFVEALHKDHTENR